MKYAMALDNFKAHKGFEVKKDVTYMVDEQGNVYIKKLICEAYSENINKFIIYNA